MNSVYYMKKRFALWGLSMCLLLISPGCHSGYDSELASEYAGKCRSGEKLSDEDVATMIEIYKDGSKELLQEVLKKSSGGSNNKGTNEQYQDLMVIAGTLVRQSRNMSSENQNRFMEVNEEIGREYRKITEESKRK